MIRIGFVLFKFKNTALTFCLFFNFSCIIILLFYAGPNTDFARLRIRHSIFMLPVGVGNFSEVIDHLLLLLLINEDFILKFIVAALLLLVRRLAMNRGSFVFVILNNLVDNTGCLIIEI